MNGSKETLGDLVLIKGPSSESVTLSGSTEYKFSDSVTYVAEAVGVVSEEPTDTLKMSTTFKVIDDLECIGECDYLRNNYIVYWRI